MSSHLIFPLETSLEQDFTINLDTISCTGIRPKLYKHKDPLGTFTLSLIDKAAATTLRSKSYTSAEINALGEFTAAEYQVGFFRFDWEYINLVKNKTYTVKLEASGYTFAESAYIGWEKEYVNQTNTITPVPSTDMENVFTFQVFGIHSGKR